MKIDYFSHFMLAIDKLVSEKLATLQLYNTCKEIHMRLRLVSN